MSRARYWQARVTWPHGAVMTFGVRAASYPAAVTKAGNIAAGTGRTPATLAVTRLYGRHHPVRRATGMREEGSTS